MTTEDKELLLKDICARLPYGVIVQVKDWAVLDAELKIGHINRLQNDDFEIKPYLFPLSSMTEGQKEEYYGTFSLSGDFSGTVDFYNKHHFDWRGLIPMGLAIDATGKNIY